MVGGFIILIIGLILLGRQLVPGPTARRLGGDLLNRLEYGPEVVQAAPAPRRVVRVHEVTDQGEARVVRRQRAAAGAGGPSEEIPF